MKVKQLFALSALALATGAVLAQETADRPLTRAEVRQQLADARAKGTPENGEGATRGDQGSEGPSQTSRAAVKVEIQQARADGTLVGPGSKSPADVTYRRLVAEPSTETRAEVKSEVLEARADGTLARAGEPGSAQEGRMTANPILANAHVNTRERVASARSK